MCVRAHTYRHTHVRDSARERDIVDLGREKEREKERECVCVFTYPSFFCVERPTGWVTCPYHFAVFF